MTAINPRIESLSKSNKSRQVTGMRNQLRRLWAASPILTATTFLMLATFAVAVVGIFVDSRLITGAPAWLKPAKFGISTAIYNTTLAWLYRYLHVWPSFLRLAAWTISLVFVVEIAIVDLQAARGVTSHFNNATPLDAALFGIMGGAIGLLLLASVGILIALFKQKFEDADWGWALRLGMLITVIGSAAGGFMIPPNAEQLRAMRAHEPVAAVGSHTVGAPDGGPGLPGVGWSTEHGDLRAPHFVGMHGVQLIPLLTWLLVRQRPSHPYKSMVFVIAGSYFALFAILAWQALRGESIVQPDGSTLITMAIWLIASAGGFLIARKPDFRNAQAL